MTQYIVIMNWNQNTWDYAQRVSIVDAIGSEDNTQTLRIQLDQFNGREYGYAKIFTNKTDAGKAGKAGKRDKMYNYEFTVVPVNSTVTIMKFAFKR